MILTAVVLAAFALAYANGANDNFKGVATLFGSRTTNYRRALAWATVTTLLGSMAAVLLATTLLTKFSGKGLIPGDVATSPVYGAAVSLGAALTVLLATRIGMPISTTHSLIGALVGAGWAAQAPIDYSRLGQGFLVPLIVSPIIAIVATVVVYGLFRWSRIRLGVVEESCVCVTDAPTIVADCHGAMAKTMTANAVLTMGTDIDCGRTAGSGPVGVNAKSLLDKLHFLSAGVVSFARGLNDTPKMAALLLLLPMLNGSGAIVLTGVTIAIGGLVSARRVAETMSEKITTMNHGQGFTANLVTGVIVIGASRYGLPVSTTHVSCGSLFGIGTVSGGANRKMILTVLLAWATTLPVGAALGAAAYLGLAAIV